MSDRLTYRIVRRLREPGAPLSRNRHFPMFEAPEGRRALRIHRRVKSVESDLAEHGDSCHVTVTDLGDDVLRVDIRIPGLRASRAAFLGRGELDILLESPVGRLLREADWCEGRPE